MTGCSWTRSPMTCGSSLLNWRLTHLVCDAVSDSSMRRNGQPLHDSIDQLKCQRAAWRSFPQNVAVRYSVRPKDRSR